MCLCMCSVLWLTSLLHFWLTGEAFQYPSWSWFAVCLLRILAAASWSSTVVLRMSSGRFPVPVMPYTAASSPKIPSATSGDSANNSSGGTEVSKSSCVVSVVADPGMAANFEPTEAAALL